MALVFSSVLEFCLFDAGVVCVCMWCGGVGGYVVVLWVYVYSVCGMGVWGCGVGGCGGGVCAWVCVVCVGGWYGT